MKIFQDKLSGNTKHKMIQVSNQYSQNDTNQLIVCTFLHHKALLFCLIDLRLYNSLKSSFFSSNGAHQLQYPLTNKCDGMPGI